MTDLWRLSALEQADLIRRGEVSCLELTDLYLSRIRRLDPGLNAFVTVLSRSARRLARARDRQRRSRGADTLPVFFGVPFGIKDLVPVRGTPTKLGSRAYKYFWSPFDVRAAKRMKRGGLVNLGKLATSEFGALPYVETDIHPPTRNPWSAGHTAGGSSGGSGAAVAASMIPIAQGSDGAGSIRIPAAFCHLYGFKPSRGLIGNLHGKVNRLGISYMGPLSRTVADAAAMLDVLRDAPFTNLDGEGSCLAASRRDPGRMRVRFCAESPLAKVEGPIVEAVERVAAQLADLGHEVEATEMVDGSLEEFLPLWQLQMAGIPALRERLLQPSTRWLRERGRRLRFEDVSRTCRSIEQRVLDWFDADILITPTVAISAPRVGAYADLPADELFEAIADIGAFTALFNISGQPAATIPAGVSEQGLPFGVQIVGRVENDHDVISVSRQLEQVMPWRQREPPLD